MDFISVTYLGFLLTAMLVYYLIPKNRQWMALLVFSIIFYSCFSLKLWIFVLFTAVTTYLYARYKSGSRALLCVTVLLNLSVLLLLKTAASGLGFVEKIGVDRLAVLLPVGISFYTLQTVAYMVDVHRGSIGAERNFFRYLLFVIFFPQILQGPIPRYEELGEQLFAPHFFDERRMQSGWYLILWGFFQKMVIADRCNLVVNRIFADYRQYDGFYFWIAGILYSLQLYTDFAGCVSIAAGSAELFGITLPPNFRQPYFCRSIQDFWHRWHMTLSRFLRDYVYIPLGGNRKGRQKKWLFIMLTFCVSGIWHGIGAHFLVWGFLHGLYQVSGELFRPAKNALMKLTGMKRDSFAHRVCGMLFADFLVMAAWIVFRAESVSKALYMVLHLFGRWNPWIFVSGELYALGISRPEWFLLFLSVLLLLLVGVLHERGIGIRARFMAQPLFLRWTVLLAGIFTVLIAGIYGPGYDAAQFIYGGF